MISYFNHLKPDGYLVLEERNINERADLGIRRILRTAAKALKDLGQEHPESMGGAARDQVGDAAAQTGDGRAG